MNNPLCPYLFSPYGVVAPGVIVGRVLLARDELLWMEQVSVRSGTHLIYIGM